LSLNTPECPHEVVDILFKTVCRSIGAKFPQCIDSLHIDFFS